MDKGITGWISTKVLLPELEGLTSDCVLAYDKNMGAVVAYLCNIENEIYWELKSNKSAHKARLNITHWQPLPITPLEEDIELKKRTNLIERFLRKIHLIT